MDNSGDKLSETWSSVAPGERTRSLLGLLAELQGEFAAGICTVEPSTAVPWCGAWTVADLVKHLTYIHHWAAAMARCEDYPDQPDSADRPRGAALRSSYEEAALDLLGTLTALDPNTPARTLLETGTVAFWHRRQVHETLVHLWDLLTAAGQALVVDPALWADTVDEAVTVMHPRQVRLGRAAPAPVRLLVVAADAGRSWELPCASTAPTALAATATGPSESVALLLWGRRRLDDPLLRVDGDPAALQAVLAARFLP